MIEARSLSAKLGSFELADISFRIEQGEYGVVIGPAGSGKTTLLETVAGVIPQRGGSLALHGLEMTRTPAHLRRLGLVYQHGFLFPHLSVRENISYGTRDNAAVDELIAALHAGDLLDRDVRSLSGGERQIVAIARALAPQPEVLLLDEPFSALDPRRRSLVRREVRRLHRERGITILQVTHDFAEAGMLGDVAILLDKGRVLQRGSPDEVFRKPASAQIAEFLGAENVFQGEIIAYGSPQESSDQGARALEFRTGALSILAVGDAAPGPGWAVIRAEEVVVSLEPHASSMRNHFRGTVAERATLGALSRITIDVGGVPLVASLTTRSAEELGLTVGREVTASFKAVAVHLC